MNPTEAIKQVSPVFAVLADSSLQVGQLRLRKQRYLLLLQKALEQCDRGSDEEALIYNLCSVLERCSQYHQAATIGEWLSYDHKARIYLNDAKLLKKQIDKPVKESA
jgi:hypothetical protein